MGSILLLRRSPSSAISKKFNRLLSCNLPLPSNVLVYHQFHKNAHAPQMPQVFSSIRTFQTGIPLKYQFVETGNETGHSDSVKKTEFTDPADKGLEIAKLGISLDIVAALEQRGITKLFPIQRAVLGPAIKGIDVLGGARTGSGKTLAFGIPILDRVLKFNTKHGAGKNPLALALAPTRELAKQVEKEFSLTAPKLDTLCVYGGVPMFRQMNTLSMGVDVVVGTPGRVIDLIQRRSLDLSDVQFVVLDEADHMLDSGFTNDVETILGYVTREHQTMMFSATLPSWVIKLSRKFLKNPVTIDLVGESDQKPADGISLYSITSEMREKPAIISPLIAEHSKGGKSIVFTGTKLGADRLASIMKMNFKCEALHGDITQDQRELTLSAFRDGSLNVLVATDVAARGLDVPNVELVIHYEVPSSKEMFVHRSGQTGRAGKKGTVILIHLPDQYGDLKAIELAVGCKFIELPKIPVAAGLLDLYSRRFAGSGLENAGGFFGGGRVGGLVSEVSGFSLGINYDELIKLCQDLGVNSSELALPSGFVSKNSTEFGEQEHEGPSLDSKFGENTYSSDFGYTNSTEYHGITREADFGFSDINNPREAGNFSKSKSSTSVCPDSLTGFDKLVSGESNNSSLEFGNSQSRENTLSSRGDRDFSQENSIGSHNLIGVFKLESGESTLSKSV